MARPDQGSIVRKLHKAFSPTVFMPRPSIHASHIARLIFAGDQLRSLNLHQGQDSGAQLRTKILN